MKFLRRLHVSIPKYICFTIQGKPLKNNHWSGKDTFGVRSVKTQCLHYWHQIIFSNVDSGSSTSCTKMHGISHNLPLPEPLTPVKTDSWVEWTLVLTQCVKFCIIILAFSAGFEKICYFLKVDILCF